MEIEGLTREEFLKVCAHILAATEGGEKGSQVSRARAHYRRMKNPKSPFWDFDTPLPKQRKGRGVSYIE